MKLSSTSSAYIPKPLDPVNTLAQLALFSYHDRGWKLGITQNQGLSIHAKHCFQSLYRSFASSSRQDWISVKNALISGQESLSSSQPQPFASLAFLFERAAIAIKTAKEAYKIVPQELLDTESELEKLRNSTTFITLDSLPPSLKEFLEVECLAFFKEIGSKEAVNGFEDVNLESRTQYTTLTPPLGLSWKDADLQNLLSFLHELHIETVEKAKKVAYERLSEFLEQKAESFSMGLVA